MSVGNDKEQLNNCGCCETDDLEYPQHYNRPGQPILKYRLNTHSGFVERMLARLSRDQLTEAEAGHKRPLLQLSARSKDDPSIAILDAWGVVADVLTFYQERIANEGYIRTASERRSVLELAHAIGYELNPGVAAGTWLAFTADNSPGSPPSAIVPKGTQVLSIPGKDEVPQTFETLDQFVARAEWNELKPYTQNESRTDPITTDVTSLRLKGTGTGLQAGDGILIVGNERINDQGSERWDFRILSSVTQADDGSYTLVTWERGLGHSAPDIDPAAEVITVHAFRVRTSVFGKNAAEWSKLDSRTKTEYLSWLMGTTSNVAISRRGRQLVAAGSDNSIQLWTYNSRRRNWEKQSIPTNGANTISSVALSASADRIFLGHANGGLSLLHEDGNDGWDELAVPASGETAHDTSVEWVAFSNDGDDMVSVGSDKEIKIWHSSDRSLLHSYVPSLTAGNLRVGSEDQVLTLWISGSPTEISSQAHEELISAVAISPNGNRLASAAADGSLKVWEPSATGGTWVGVEYHAEGGGPAHDGPVTSLAFSENSLQLASTGMDGKVLQWNLNTQAVSNSFTTSTLDYLTEWPDFGLDVEVGNQQLYLGERYTSIVPNSWMVLSKPTYVEIYRVLESKITWHSQFNLSGDVNRLKLDSSEHFTWFGRRESTVYAQSEALELYTEQVAVKQPVEGRDIELNRLTPGLEIERRVVVSGKRMRARVVQDSGSLTLKSVDGLSTRTLEKDDILLVMSRPYAKNAELSWVPTSDGFRGEVSLATAGISWHLRDRYGFIGTITTDSNNIHLIPARSEEDEDPAVEKALQEFEWVSEVMTIKERDDIRHDAHLIVNSVLRFESDLLNIYDHDTVSINANVVAASHGETVAGEVMGSGNGTLVNQRFTLNKAPLTYISAPTVTGGESTLEVRVNDVLWQEVDSLYQEGPRSQVYTLRQNNDGNSIITFGDGYKGARLPSGQENITATYRSGIGLEGQVGSSTLKLLKSKPLGIREVTNPLPATGAASPESLDDARAHAPLTVLTLDRIVSVKDFEDFAAAFAGVGKAQATVLWNGETNVVHITIASASGDTVYPTDQLYINLVQALEQVRDVTVQVLVDGYRPLSFKVDASLHIDSRYLRDKVIQDVKAALRAAFTFDKRAFGQDVTEVEVLTIINSVEGVIAAELNGEAGLDIIDVVEDKTYPSLNKIHLRAEKADWDSTRPRPTLGAQLLLISTATEAIQLLEIGS